jgi:hypothetical protein
VAIVARVIRGAFKLRYLVLGSAVGGGVQLTRVCFEFCLLVAVA